MKTFSPQSIDEAQSWVKEHVDAGNAFRVCGNGSRFFPSASKAEAPFEGDLLSMKDVNGTCFFDPDDLVVGVEAGMSINALNAILHEKNMILPANPWFRDSCIGSVVACNDFGANRMLMGGLRDSIIGLEYINGNGERVQAGGKVVKNVSGYDLTRMMLGSQGGLGVLCSVNFKINPKSVEPHAMMGIFEDSSWKQMLEKVHQNRIPLDWIQSFSLDDSKWMLGLGFSGNALNRQRIVKEIEQVFGAGLTVVAEGENLPETDFVPGMYRFEGFISEFRKAWKLPENHFHLHASMPTDDFFRMDFDSFHKQKFKLVIHPVGGDIHFLHEETNYEQQLELLKHIQHNLNPTETKLRWSNADPKASFEDLGNWGVASGYSLVKRLKRHLDPANVFWAPYYHVERPS